MKNKTQGIAFVTVLLLMVVLVSIFVVTFQLAISNIAQSGLTSQASKTLSMSQGARNLGQSIIRGPVGENLGETIIRMAQNNQIGSASTWVFATGDTNSIPTPSVVAAKLAQLGTALQSSMNASGCYGPYSLSSTQNISVRVSFTGVIPACDGAPQENVTLGVGRYISGGRNTTQTYSLPYVMVVSATDNNARRTLTVTGEYQFDVGNGSFARFALLTDEQQQNPTDPSIYFTSRTLFNGPVHTNGNFAFRGNPWFGGSVSSSGGTDRKTPGAYFSGYTTTTTQERYCAVGFGSLCLRYATREVTRTSLNTEFLSPSQLTNPTYGDTAPAFNSGVDWEADTIPFPNSSTSQRDIARTSGLYISDNPANIEFSISTVNGVKYQKIKVGDTTYLAPDGGGLYVQSGNSLVPVKNSDGKVITFFNGVIYSENEVRSVKGPARSSPDIPSSSAAAIASFSQITLASPNSIRITGDIKYENNPCDGTLSRNASGQVIVPNCNDDPNQIKNVLGIYSSNSDVKLGLNNTDAALNVPKDVQINATLMASNEVKVENFNTGDCSKGTAYILGGVITRKYGGFGTFDSQSGNCSTGLGRSFTYDQRMLQGLAPPAFPTTNLTNLLANRRSIQFNQTEQTRR